MDRPRRPASRPRLLLLPLLLAGPGACGGDAEPFRIDVTSRPWIEARAASWSLDYFPERGCGPLELAGGRPDVVRTATAAVRRRSPDKAGLGSLDLSGLEGIGAIDVRALDEDGTPLGQRCVEVTRLTAEGSFRLLPLAPEGATVTVRGDTAFRAGGAVRPIEVEVRDAEGLPVRGVFVSSTPEAALTLTDERGIAAVDTPTLTPPLDALVELEVYGVPGLPIGARAVVVPAPACPEVLSTAPLPTGSAAVTELAVADDVVVVVRPDGAGRSLVEVLRPPGRRRVLERAATATTAGFGPVAVAADRRDGAYTIAVGGVDGAVHVLRFDPNARRLSRAGTVTASAAGPVPRLSALALGPIGAEALPGPSLFVSAPELTPPVQRLTADAPGGFRPAVAAHDGDRAPASLGLGDVDGDGRADLVSVFADRLELRLDAAAPGPAHTAEDRAGALAIGALDVRVDDPAELVLLDRPPGVGPVLHVLSFVDGALVDRGSTAIPAGDLLSLVELNDDGLPDVLVVSIGAEGGRRVVGSGRGQLLDAGGCELPDLSRIAAVDLDGDGAAEWVALARDARELAVLGR